MCFLFDSDILEEGGPFSQTGSRRNAPTPDRGTVQMDLDLRQLAVTITQVHHENHLYM